MRTVTRTLFSLRGFANLSLFLGTKGVGSAPLCPDFFGIHEALGKSEGFIASAFA